MVVVCMQQAGVGPFLLVFHPLMCRQTEKDVCVGRRIPSVD